MDKQSLIRFSYMVLSLIILIGVGIYYFLPQTIWSGFGLSSAIMCFPSLLHFRFRNQEKEKSIESIFTSLLLICVVLGVILIFTYKWIGAADFYVGIGGGIALVSAITYTIELVIRFVESIR